MVHRIPDSFERGSVFSEDRRYRYSLFRKWAEGPMVMFCGLNPSIADDSKNDPTIARCQAFAQKWGYGGLNMANLFALVSTDPKALNQVDDPVGPDNDATLLHLHKTSAKTVVAWGCKDELVHQRAIKVANILRKEKEIYALATCKDNCPRHPLYLKQTLDPVLYGGYI